MPSWPVTRQRIKGRPAIARITVTRSAQMRHGLFKAQNACTRMCSMVLQQSVREVMTTPVLTVTPETPLQEAVAMMSDHHISGLPVVDAAGVLVGEITEQDLMVRESGVDVGPYVMLLDSVIYLRNPLHWDRQVHQVLGTAVNDLMRRDSHTCAAALPLPRAASCCMNAAPSA